MTCKSTDGFTATCPVNGRVCDASRTTAMPTLVANKPMMILVAPRFSL